MSHSYRWSWTTGIALLAGVVLLVSACGGGDDDDSSDGDGSDADATATKDSGNNGSGSQSGGDATATQESGGDGGDSGDIEEIEKDLAPPDSKELVRYSTPDGTSVSYESNESLDSLKDFYDGRIDDLDVNVLGTMSLNESHSWFIGSDDGRGVQGSVTIADAGNGKTTVTITLSEGT